MHGTRHLTTKTYQSITSTKAADRRLRKTSGGFFGTYLDNTQEESMPVNLKGRSFLTLRDFTPEEIRYMLDLSHDLKAKKRAGIKGNQIGRASCRERV